MSKKGPKPRHRPVLIVVVVLGALVCLVLGYWQLSRWNSSTGSYTNLGYALEWPFFAAFLVFLYWRFIKLEAEREAEDLEEAGESPSGDAQKSDDPGDDEAPVTEIPADILPTRRPTVDDVVPEDEAIAAYNDYLADLNRKAE